MIDDIENIIRDAIEKKVKIIIKYKSTDSTGAELTTRTVEPLVVDYGKKLNINGCHLKHQELYLVAFCELRQDIRVFNVNRILDVKLTKYLAKHNLDKSKDTKNRRPSREPYFPEQCVISILKNALELDDQHIWQGLLSKKFPIDGKDLFITVELPWPRVSVHPLPNQLCIGNHIEKTNEHEFYCRSIIQIDLISHSNISKKIRMKVIDALKSNYSISMQKKYPFRIIDIPDSFIDTSDLMTNNYNRFTITITVISDVDITIPDFSMIHSKFIESKELLSPDKYFNNLDELVRYVEKEKIHLFLSSFCYGDYTGECSLEKSSPSNTFYETIVETLLKATNFTSILEIYDRETPNKKIGNWAILSHEDYIDTYSIERLKRVLEDKRHLFSGN